MLLCWDIGKRVECVGLFDGSSKAGASISQSMIQSHLLPRFERITPAVCIWVSSNPLSGATIEIEVVGGGKDDGVTLLSHRRDEVR